MKDAKSTIEAGKAILGIEFGSTRIKAVLIDQENKPIAQEVTPGKTSWKTDSGPTALKPSGLEYRTAMLIFAQT